MIRNIQRSLAFTLIEILFVLFFASVVALFASNYLSQLIAKSRMEKATAQLAFMLKSAQLCVLYHNAPAKLDISSQRPQLVTQSQRVLKSYSSFDKSIQIKWHGLQNATGLWLFPDINKNALSGHFDVTVQGYPNLVKRIVVNRVGRTTSSQV